MPLLLLWPASLVLMWFVAQNIANKPFDRALEYKVQTIARLVVVQGNTVKFEMTADTRELLRDDVDQVYFQVLGIRGELLDGEKDLPLPPLPSVVKKSTEAELVYRDDEIRGLPIRMAYVWVRTSLPDAQDILVQVAETRENRSILATDIIKGIMLPQFIILPMAVLLVWFALYRGTRPMKLLENRIRLRKPDDLSPLDEVIVPLEVVPLVSSVNGLLARLKDAMVTQKRFLTDAAHQLKTPLAGLRMQAELALRQSHSTEDLKLSLQQIGRSSIRATHTVNQLLALARAEGDGQVMPEQVCNLSDLVKDVIQDALPKAIEKHIDLGFESANVPRQLAKNKMVRANPTLIKELIRNLIDNALNYTPSTSEQPGIVTVRVFTDDQTCILQVEDSGVGIPDAEKQLVMQPFYRALGTNADGSGLGLAIVQEIAKKHGAVLTIEDAKPGHIPTGAKFTIRFFLNPRDRPDNR